jgi:predicted nuclease of predicted toxin-antitoxin system
VRSNGFAIVSKDADFRQMSFLFGTPPKVIWLRLGNCTTDDIIRCLGESEAAVANFLLDPESPLLVLDS